MLRRPLRSTRTDPLLSYTTLFRSVPGYCPALVALGIESSTTGGDFGMVSSVTWDRLSRFLTLAASGRNFETMTGTRLHPPPTLMPIGQVTAKLFPHPLNAWYAAAWDHEVRSEEHTSELQSLMRISYAVFCLKKKKTQTPQKQE